MAIGPAVSKTVDKMIALSPTMKVASALILKDAVGCYLYVSQARSNKKMTPKERADVANYDLFNGIINVVIQLLAVKPIETAMKKFVDSKIMKKFFVNLDKQLANTDNKSVMALLGKKAALAEGAVALLSVIICQYLIKRGVAPFLSVPLAEKSKRLGIVKPKLYEGETYDKTTDKIDTVKKENKIKKTNTIGPDDKISFSKNLNFKDESRYMLHPEN